MIVGILFAILSPAVYSLVNYFDKFFLEKLHLQPLVIVIFSGIIAFFISILLLIIFGIHLLPFFITLAIIFSGIMTELYMLPYFKALSLEDASTIVPLFQFQPVFILIGDALFLGEKLTTLQYIGAFFIIFSGLLLSLERVSMYVVRPRKAFWYMLLSCLLVAISVLLFKYGVEAKNFWYILPYEGIGIFIGALLLALVTQKSTFFFKEIRRLSIRIYGLMFVNELLFISARYFSFFALSLLSASLVGILGGFQPLFVLIYGVILSLWFPFILKETISKKTFGIKVFAIIMILIGASFLSV